MSELSQPTDPAERRWLVFNAAAAVLAVAGVVSLALVLLQKWGGGHPWVGFDWIAMIGLPVAFVMMGAGLVRAVRRRRRL
ncbi:hypothetical protein [Specibacter cremeus]|uniref:hypothetical protein n=1 Tax=Specibacter cremeus TaxID=1629051 RepID=UPI000F7B5A07|nr:hypothetical protein [Specibacter cremeus]